MPPSYRRLTHSQLRAAVDAGRAPARAAVHGADVRQRRERAPRAAPHPARRGRSPRRRDRAVLDPRRARPRSSTRSGCGRCATRTATRSRSSCACISRSRARPSAGRGSSTTPISTAASTSTRGCGSARRLLCDINALGSAGRRRVPRHDLAAVHLGSRRVGRDRRAHDREPGASRAGVGLVVPRRVQERHRRQRQDRRRRRRRRVASASFPGRDQGRSGDRGGDGRQSRRARDPARRQDAELRRRARRGRVPAARASRACRRGS